MLQRHGTLKLTLYGSMIGVLCMAIWIEILNRWHMSEPLYFLYAGLLGMGAIYGAVGTAAICGLLKLFGRVRARLRKC
jgi:hypothetical protein